MSLVWIIIQVLIGYNLVLPVLLYLISLIKERRFNSDILINYGYDYGIIVTAYEQTDMLLPVINSILQLNYSNYHVYVIADNCDISNLHISHPNISIFSPENILSNNVKSHFYAIDRFHRKHDIITIIDSDNLVHSEYINELNAFFGQGFDAVQGRRKAKNLNTPLACLDAARDDYYNFYDGEILFKLGSSSTLSGSGMAFKTDVYKECLEDLEINGAGFDKVLQAQLVRKGYRIACASEAIIFDEKTMHSKQLIDQRSRWINTWFKYFRYGFILCMTGVKNRNFNQFLFGITLLRPPLFIFLLLSIICFIVNLFISPLSSVIWVLSIIIFVLGFFVALNKQGAPGLIYKSLTYIPKFILYQLISLYYSRVANKRSVATKHSHLNSIEYDKR